MASVEDIWRYPIKSHGREKLADVRLLAGQTMPWDRTWALAHDAAKTDGTEWAQCVNFSRGAKAPALMAINARLDTSSETISLSHPDRDPLTVQPDTEDGAAALLEWVRPLMPEGRAQSVRVVRVPNRGMTDTDYPSVSLGNISSHRAVEQKLGRRLSDQRWRINFWLDGFAPWEEFEWVGKHVQIGDAVLNVIDPITRCAATTANPETGKRDADTLGVLQDGWDHQYFGIYAEVIETGRVARGDTVSLL